MPAADRSSPPAREVVDVASRPWLRAVGLGEPTHGSGNIVTSTWDIVIALAETGRLAALCLEAPTASTTALSQAVHSGGDVATPMECLGAMFGTREFETGVRRLQEHNLIQPPESRVLLCGVDFQSPRHAAERLIERGHQTPALELLRRDGSRMASTRVGDLATDLRSLALGDEVEDVRLARQLQHYVHVYLEAPDRSRLWKRDQILGDAVLDVVDRSDGLVVVWAHNEHVAVNPCFEDGHPSMGWYLRSALGPAYLTVAALCGGGEVRAVDLSRKSEGWQRLRLDAPAPITTEAALAGAEPVELNVDTRSWSHPGPRRMIGWCYEPGKDDQADYLMHRPTADFDHLRWFSTSAAARPRGAVGMSEG